MKEGPVFILFFKKKEEKKNKNMKTKYDSLFDLRDAEDRYYYENIPLLDVELFLVFLKDWVECIRKHNFSQKEFAKFKLDVLSYKCPELVVWNVESLNVPYVMFDLNWDNITTSRIAYVAMLMISNTSVLIPDSKVKYPLSYIPTFKLK